MSRVDSPLRDRAVFVVGARRSGTNWLERILTAHPAVVAVATETYIFSHGIQPLAESFQHANPSAPSMGRAYIPRDAFLDSVRDLVDRVMLEPLSENGGGARFVVERTPWHASHLPLIADVYPDGRVIHIVRDGRDVARSLLSMPWGPDTMAEAAEEWRRSTADAQEGGRAFGDRYLEVVYEHMLEDPRRRTAAIFDWLGLDLSDETWKRIEDEAGSEFNVDPGSPGVRAEKWRGELSATDVSTFEEIAGGQLDALGYARAAPAPGGRARAAAAGLRERIGGGALGKTALRLRHPRGELRRRRERRLGQRLHSDQIASHELVGRFERRFTDGDEDGARELLSPRVSVSIEASGRGVAASDRRGSVDELLQILGAHRELGVRVLSGRTHASPYSVTTIAHYSLPDGSRWLRVLVYGTRRRRIASIGLHLAELPADGRP